MAKIILILSVTMALQLCVIAAPNTDDHTQEAIEESPKIDEAEIKSDSEPPEVSNAAEITNDQNPQGQRQKRFNDYFDFGFTSYDQYNPLFVKRDESQNTGVYGAQDAMSQIFRRVQTILNYTRRQAHSPPVAHYPVPSFIPFLYIPHYCGCTLAGRPNDQESTNGARPTPTTTTPTADPTPQPIAPANDADTSPTANTDNSTPDLSSRSPDIDEEEYASRPISFIPIKPKTPLSRPPPPVEHGSSQAGIGNSGNEVADVVPSTTRRPNTSGVAPQAHLPTNMIPTLCDGAVLTCCHRAEVTYDCFLSQGCPNPTQPDNPCDENIILDVIGKFQYYYANRRV